LFLDPGIKLPKAKVAWTLLRRKMGMRALMEVTPLDAGLVKGSHGRNPSSPAQGPLLLTHEKQLLAGGSLPAPEVFNLLLRHVFD
jgi:hypothetical protein